MALAFISNLNGSDLALILLVLILLFGAKKLPKTKDKEADEREEKEIRLPAVAKPPRIFDALKVIAGPLVSL